MNQLEAKIFAAELREDLPTLDLHGFYPSEALEKLELFLYSKAQAHEDTVRIIYGGGTGKLKAEVLVYLKKHPLAGTIKDEGGAAIVLL